MPNENTSSYRIEERDAQSGVALAFTDQGWDGPLTDLVEAQNWFARELREHPGRYAVGSPFRLVLLGPDRAVKP